MSKCCNGGIRTCFTCLIRLIFVMKHAAHEDLLIHYRFERLNKIVSLSSISNEPLGIAHLGKEVSCVLLGIIDKGFCESAYWVSVVKWNSVLYLWIKSGVEAELRYNVLMQLKESPDDIGDRFIWWAWFFEVYDWIGWHHECHGGYTWGEKDSHVEIGKTRGDGRSDFSWVCMSSQDQKDAWLVLV